MFTTFHSLVVQLMVQHQTQSSSGVANSSVGITMSNIVNLTMTKLLIENCKMENNILNIDRWIFIGNGMVLSHCYNVQLQDIAVYRSKQWHGSTILVITVLGISSFINITSNGLIIEYNEVYVDNVYNKLLLENYQIPCSTKDRYYNSVITIHFYQRSYKIELEVHNTRFTTVNNRLFKVVQLANKFGNFIHFSQCIVEKFNSTSELTDLFYFDTSLPLYGSYHQVTFTNCVFRYNKFHRVFTVYGNVNIRLESCIFKYNQFQVIKMTDSLYKNYMAITNTSFYAITSNSTLIYISSALLHLEGPVIFVKLKAHRILYIQYSISCHNYIKFSQNVVSLADRAHHIVVQENTLINMTNNEYSTIEMIKAQHYGAYTISNFTAPCYYQYTAGGKIFDELTGKLNFSIVFHNDISIYTLMTAHCRWIPGSAFNSTKTIDVNMRLINSDFPLEYDKLFCYCHNNNTEDCSTGRLAVVFPGQTISLSLMLNYLYRTKFSDNTIDLDFIQNHIITVQMNDDVLSPTACKVAKVSELVQQIYYTSCTTINFTIVHNGLSYLQWCELFINILSTHQIDVYYIDIFPCPAGFVYQNGICICDPILKSIPITTCDINHQTILRPAVNWLSAVTINISHQYHTSSHCPLHYCLPQSSQLNFSTPNSQCQFNRSGLLCGHCQQGLSTVFGYYHCQHCSNVYLLLVIPIAVAGLVLVLLLFILNLTITDGDINGFILYFNIISINNHVFFPQYHNNLMINFWYAFVSLANLDLGIPTCFYNGMDDYAKMWLQLAFPSYLILIATFLIIASRHSTKVQRITARRALPVLATLFLLSYTKILRTASSVLFYYSTITHLPGGHTTLVWAVDANIPLFGLKYTTLFVVCLILFIVLLPFNAILCFTKTAMRLQLVNHFKPLIDAYQGPYKYKYYYWTGLQLVVRAVFFGLSALDRNINLTVGIILLAIISTIQAKINPFKSSYKNFYESCFLLYLSAVYAFSYGQYSIAVNVMITMAALQFLLIINHHIINNACSGVIMYNLKNITNLTVKWITRSHNKLQQNVELNNTPPDKAYNYQELREPLVGQD